MKRFFGFAIFAVLAAGTLHAQATATTVCDVLKDPAAFDGKIVTIKGVVSAGFDQFVIKDSSCAQEVDAIWLDYPAGSKAKAGPQIMVELAPASNFAGKAAAANRVPVTLTKDKEFKQFDSALSSAHSNGNMCLGCAKDQVQATLTGRLDGVKETLIQRTGGKITGLGGFGNLNQYPARLVIASVADVTTTEIDYSKADAAAKLAQKGQEQQQGPPNPTGQPQTAQSPAEARAAADKMVALMAAGPITTQLQKDLAMLPKQNENNGVVIGYGTANEVAANEGAPATTESPDGLIYKCTINRDRVQNMSMTVAFIHLAQHIADVRSPMAGNEMAPLAILENNAWAVTTTMAIFGGEKVVTAPGGYLMWNSAWPQAEQVSDMQAVLADLIGKEEGLHR